MPTAVTRIAVVAMMVTSWSAAVLAQGPQGAVDDLESAVAARLSGHLEAATAQARTLLSRLSPERDAVLYGRAEALAGELAEDRLAFDEARDHYQAAVKYAPATVEGERAAIRLAAIAPFVGNFEELALVGHARRGEATREEVLALEEQAPTFASRMLRDEALAMVAQAWVERLGDPSRGARVARTLTEVTERDEMRRRGWELMLDGAIRAADEALLAELQSDPRAPAAVKETIARRGRRRGAVLGSTVVLVWTACAAAFAIVRALLRRRGRQFATLISAPLPLAFIGLMAGGGALASQYGEGSSPVPFFLLGGVTFAAHVFGSAWRACFGRGSRWARGLGGATAGLFVVASAFWVLVRTGASGQPLLDALGL